MNKKKNKRIILIFLIVGIILFGLVGYKVYVDFFKKDIKEVDSIEYYGYTLSNTDTSLYKTNFEALRKVLNTEPMDYSEYAKSISKLFIIDLFTLNNKLTSTDIGGKEFIHPDLKSNFKENMGNNMYKFIESNLNGDRTQSLPIVSKIDVDDIFETKYTYKDKEYDAYLVTLTWEYEEDLGYQTTMKLTIIKSDNILYIVKGE